MSPAHRVQGELLLFVELQPDRAISETMSLHLTRIEVLNVPHDASQPSLIVGRKLTISGSPADEVQIPFSGLRLISVPCIQNAPSGHRLFATLRRFGCMSRNRNDRED
jgi:hypothetical protein